MGKGKRIRRGRKGKKEEEEEEEGKQEGRKKEEEQRKRKDYQEIKKLKSFQCQMVYRAAPTCISVSKTLGHTSADAVKATAGG